MDKNKLLTVLNNIEDDTIQVEPLKVLIDNGEIKTVKELLKAIKEHGKVLEARNREDKYIVTQFWTLYMKEGRDYVRCYLKGKELEFHTLSKKIDIYKGTIRGLFIALSKKKNKIVYFKIEHKLEKIPGVIRGDGKCHLLLSDPAQIEEPFISFTGLIKNIRDATSHYNQGKADIWRRPHEWVEIAHKACKICLEVAKVFWMTCYPDKVLPIYLGGLDEEKHIKIAEKRLVLESTGISNSIGK